MFDILLCIKNKNGGWDSLCITSTPSIWIAFKIATIIEKGV